MNISHGEIHTPTDLLLAAASMHRSGMNVNPQNAKIGQIIDAVIVEVQGQWVTNIIVKHFTLDKEVAIILPKIDWKNADELKSKVEEKLKGLPADANIPDGVVGSYL